MSSARSVLPDLDLAQRRSLTGDATILRSGRRHHRILLRPEFGDRNGADRNDDVGRHVQATRREPDRLLVRCFIKAVSLATVRAKERKEPLDSDLVVDLLDLQEARIVEMELLRKIPLDQEKRHDRCPSFKWLNCLRPAGRVSQTACMIPIMPHNGG